jgi:major membrane immunogen (membrane-anchored lipoprotein)
METKSHKNLMKIAYTLLLFVLLTSCYQQERNCKAFKTGTFTSETEIEGKKFTSSFVRNDSMQIETYEGKIDTFKVRWTNDCEYIIQNTHPKNSAEKKPVQMKILTTNSTSYTFEYSFVGDSKKQRGTATKLN